MAKDAPPPPPRIPVVIYDAENRPYAFLTAREWDVSTALRSGAETWRYNLAGWTRLDQVPPPDQLPEPDLAPR